jgi:hypothetical protein
MKSPHGLQTGYEKGYDFVHVKGDGAFCVGEYSLAKE